MTAPLEPQPDSGALPPPEDLADSLLDAAALGGFDHALDAALNLVGEHQAQLSPLDAFRYRVLFFDLALVSTNDFRVQRQSAIELVAAAIETGELGWPPLHQGNRLPEIERLAIAPDLSLELLELLSYAPDAGTRAFAVIQLESGGMRLLDAQGDSRPLERLLHAVGASDAAYRLEAARKQRRALPESTPRAAANNEMLIPYRVVAIAGGHAQLRVATANLLGRQGIRIVQIPSSREAVRREKEITHLLQGCDLVVLLVRQITHSTSDQVRKVAERLQIPVFFSNGLSAVAIERHLIETGER